MNTSPTRPLTTIVGRRFFWIQSAKTAPIFGKTDDVSRSIACGFCPKIFSQTSQWKCFTAVRVDISSVRWTGIEHDPAHHQRGTDQPLPSPVRPRHLQRCNSHRGQRLQPSGLAGWVSFKRTEMKTMATKYLSEDRDLGQFVHRFAISAWLSNRSGDRDLRRSLRAAGRASV